MKLHSMQRTETVILLFLMMSSPHSIEKLELLKHELFNPKKRRRIFNQKGKFQYYATVDKCLLQTPALNNEIWKLTNEN